MTITHLVDTDWVVHYLNGRSDIVARLDVLKHQGLGLSVVSLGELYEGVYYSHDPEGDERGLHDFLQGVSLVGLDEETAKIFGKFITPTKWLSSKGGGRNHYTAVVQSSLGGTWSCPADTRQAEEKTDTSARVTKWMTSCIGKLS